MREIGKGNQWKSYSRLMVVALERGVWLARFAKPDRTARFGLYHTIPVLNRDGSVMENGPDPGPFENVPNRTEMVRFILELCISVWFGPSLDAMFLQVGTESLKGSQFHRNQYAFRYSTVLYHTSQ